MSRKLSLFFSVTLLICTLASYPKSAVAAERVLLATTTSTYDSGFLDCFLPVFEQKYDYQVEVISLGTGQALEVGKNGDVDLVLVHAKDSELRMVEQGHYVDRYDVMYNDYIIVGPKSNPAGINRQGTIKAVFAAFAHHKAPFISRGDDSGTHQKELSLWQLASVTPVSPWYISVGSGMGDTLRMADEMQGYTLSDRATYLALRDKLDLVIAYQGSASLFNQYGIMAVNPDNYPGVNYQGASSLIAFFVSKEGQALISDFQPFGDTLFFPNANSK